MNMASLRERMVSITQLPALQARLRDASPIREEEAALYEHIRSEITRKTIEKYSVAPAEAEAELQSYERTLGPRGLLRLLMEPPVILGAPHECLIINGMAAFLVLSITQSVFATVVTFLVLHLAAILWYLKQRPRFVAQRLQNILEKGLEV